MTSAAKGDGALVIDPSVPKLPKHLSTRESTAGFGVVAARLPTFRSRIWARLVTVLSPLGELGMTYLYEKDLSKPLSPFTARVEVIIGEATPADIEQVVATIAVRSPHQADRIRQGILDRLRRGARCFVAKIDGRVVHHNWLIFDRVESWPASSRSVLGNNEAYCTDAYTVEDWRGRAIHTEVLYRMLSHLQQAGYHRAYTAVEAANEASWKTHVRLGWTLCGIAVHFRRQRSDRAWVWATRWRPGNRT